jgi:aspartate aminotransferase-like enzyme
MVSVSPQAWVASERATLPRFYFDLAAHRDSAAKGETPWTPAVGVCFALDVALDIIEAEGYPAIFARHAACGAATRAGLSAMGFQLFADPRHASNTVTSALVPEGVEWSALSREIRARGLVLAGGQGSLTGKLFRVGHLGAVSVDDILRSLEILEEAAVGIGVAVQRWVATTAAADAAAASSSAGGSRTPVLSQPA